MWAMLTWWKLSQRLRVEQLLIRGFMFPGGASLVVAECLAACGKIPTWTTTGSGLPKLVKRPRSQSISSPRFSACFWTLWFEAGPPGLIGWRSHQSFALVQASLLHIQNVLKSFYFKISLLLLAVREFLVSNIAAKETHSWHRGHRATSLEARLWCTRFQGFPRCFWSQLEQEKTNPWTWFWIRLETPIVSDSYNIFLNYTPFIPQKANIDQSFAMFWWQLSICEGLQLRSRLLRYEINADMAAAHDCRPGWSTLSNEISSNRFSESFKATHNIPQHPTTTLRTFLLFGSSELPETPAHFLLIKGRFQRSTWPGSSTPRLLQTPGLKRFSMSSEDGS